MKIPCYAIFSNKMALFAHSLQLALLLLFCREIQITKIIDSLLHIVVTIGSALAPLSLFLYDKVQYIRVIVYSGKWHYLALKKNREISIITMQSFHNWQLTLKKYNLVNAPFRLLKSAPRVQIN